MEVNKPYKCKIRAPGFSHLQAMDYLMKGHMLADVPAVLGSIGSGFWRGRSMSIKKISNIQPESFEFSKDNLLEAENEIKKYPKDR